MLYCKLYLNPFRWESQEACRAKDYQETDVLANRRKRVCEWGRGIPSRTGGIEVRLRKEWEGKSVWKEPTVESEFGLLEVGSWLSGHSNFSAAFLEEYIYLGNSSDNI